MDRGKLLLILLALMLPVLAWAQTDEDMEEAKRLYDVGRRYFDEGRYKEALARIQAAHTLSPHSILMYNIALCYEKLDAPEKAIEAYRSYLKSEPEAGDRATIEIWIRNLEESLKAEVAVTTNPPGAHIIMEDREMGVTPCTLRLAPGPHRLRAELKGHQPHRWDMEAKRKGQHRLEATLPALVPVGRLALAVGQEGAVVMVDGQTKGTSPLAYALTLTPGPHEVAIQAPGFAPHSQMVAIRANQLTNLDVTLMPLTSGMEIAAWTTAGLAGAALATSAILAGLRASTSGELEDMVGAEPWSPRGQGLLSDMDGYEVGAWVMMGTAIASAVASTILFILEHRGK